MKIALLCGGPSLERGISLNSARSVCDHLHSDEIEVLPIYFDHKKTPYLISRAQLYSNTPSDFDFKLHSAGKPLSKTAFERFIKSIDLAFPVMHGPFGEDGEIQRMLTRLNCPFVGSPEDACKSAFDKYKANQLISKHGFYALPSIVLKGHLSNHKKLVTNFFKEQKIKRAVVKPATGGSSIAVSSVSTVSEALEKAHDIFSKRVDTRVVIEPFCEGTEFTVVLLQNRFGMPVALMPTEMELSYRNHQLFDYRKKYLATNQIRYHCPPRFGNEVIERIQVQAEHLFALLGMKDFARFDGWLMPDGNLWFSDFNPISGMEQNSFLFMQAARIGMSHGDVLRYVIKSACRRYSIPDCRTSNGTNRGSGIIPQSSHNRTATGNSPEMSLQVNVLFGGNTAERQVSVMSGTNVWLKLKKSDQYDAHPFLLDPDHNVWKIPYALALNHTVEEILENCESAQKDEARLHDLIQRVVLKLSADPGELSEPWFLPKKMTLRQFIKQSEFVFIGLHGGVGEDGTLQTMLAKANIPFNGSDALASQIGMDKYKTGELIAPLKQEGIHSAKKRCEPLRTFSEFSDAELKQYWKSLLQELGSQTLVAKPLGDGCSAGVAHLVDWRDLNIYLQYTKSSAAMIPAGLLKQQHGIVEMPTNKMSTLMFEQYIITDKVRIITDQVKWQPVTDWIEITMGLVGKKGSMKAMYPSVTVARGSVLSLEEKFQGGTGVNITPPPTPYVKKSATQKAMRRMEKVANLLGFGGYCRIDAFMHTKTGELIIIEANTTPALTPSTVIYHQALEEKPSMYPTAFLEKVVGLGLDS